QGSRLARQAGAAERARCGSATARAARTGAGQATPACGPGGRRLRPDRARLRRRPRTGPRARGVARSCRGGAGPEHARAVARTGPRRMSLPLLRWDAAGPYEVAFSTRQGGVSDGRYSSLNLGLLTDDMHANVEENRRRLCAAIDADPARLAMNRQVHAATVNQAESGQRGKDGDGL